MTIDGLRKATDDAVMREAAGRATAAAAVAAATNRERRKMDADALARTRNRGKRSAGNSEYRERKHPDDACERREADERRAAGCGGCCDDLHEAHLERTIGKPMNCRQQMKFFLRKRNNSL